MVLRIWSVLLGPAEGNIENMGLTSKTMTSKETKNSEDQVVADQKMRQEYIKYINPLLMLI